MGFILHRYENKYVKFFKSKPELPPGLSPEANAQPGRPAPRAESGEVGLSKTAKRNLKRKEKRKQQQEKGEKDTDELIQVLEKTTLSGGGAGDRGLPAPPQPLACGAKAPGDGEALAAVAEKTKKIKNLRKKLRQVEELQQRVDSGEIKQPSREQLEKLARRKALEEELEDLELDL